MIYRRLQLLVLAVVVTMVLGVSDLWGVIWQVEQFPPFVVHYHPQDAKNIPGVIRSLNEQYPVIRERLGIEPVESVNIFVAPTLRDFQQLSQAQLPRWVEGYAMPSRNMMVLKSPSYSRPMRELGVTAVHELVHLLLGLEMGDVIVPRWLDEGLAVTLSGEGANQSKSILSWAILSGRLQGFLDIEHVMGMSAQEARLAYLESTMALDELRLRKDWSGVRELLGELKATGDFDSAMYQVYGVDEAGFEWEFFKKLRTQYRWAVLVDPMFYFAVSFIPLLGLAGYMVWRKKRRILKEWEEESPSDVYWGERNP
jgi:hypothetical protein